MRIEGQREREKGRLARVRSRRLGPSLGPSDNLLRRSDGGSERHEHTETTHSTPGHSRYVRPDHSLRSNTKVIEKVNKPKS